MNFFTDVAQFFSQKQFNLRVNILYTFFYLEIAGDDLPVNDFQLGREFLPFIVGQQPNRFEHLNVRQGAQHIEACQVQVQFTVSPDGKPRYFAERIVSFLPEFHNRLQVIGSWFHG